MSNETTILVDFPADHEIVSSEVVDGKLVVKTKVKDYLTLRVTSFNSLNISYKGKTIMLINQYGKLHFCTEDGQRDAYEKWLESDRLVDPTIVEWRGSKYQLCDGYLRNIVSNCASADIFNFNSGVPYIQVRDTNIQRYSNGTPIMFSC